MSEVAEQVAASSPAGEQKMKKAAKKPRTKPKHPPTAEMVDAAISALKERGGSSVSAIKKYVAVTYKIDIEKSAPFIKKYIKGAVVKGHLLQTKGRGASGSFKLSTKASEVKKSAVKSKKAAVASKPKTIKKQSDGKKPAVAKKTEAKKPAVAKKSESKKPAAARKAGTVKAKPAASKPKEIPKKTAASNKKAKKPAAPKKVPAKK